MGGGEVKEDEVLEGTGEGMGEGGGGREGEGQGGREREGEGAQEENEGLGEKVLHMEIARERARQTAIYGEFASVHERADGTLHVASDFESTNSDNLLTLGASAPKAREDETRVQNTHGNSAGV